MLPIKLFWLVFCMFWFNRNIETLCSVQNRNMRFVSDSAKTSFGSSLVFFECIAPVIVTLNLTTYMDRSYNIYCLQASKAHWNINQCAIDSLF